MFNLKFRVLVISAINADLDEAGAWVMIQVVAYIYASANLNQSAELELGICK